MLIKDKIFDNIYTKSTFFEDSDYDRVNLIINEYLSKKNDLTSDTIIANIRKDKNLIELLHSEKFKLISIKMLNDIFGYDDFEDYPIANARVRCNYPDNSHSSYLNQAKWHQDVGTWQDKKHDLWNYISFTVWVPIFSLRNDNGLYVEKKANHHIYDHVKSKGSIKMFERLEENIIKGKMYKTTEDIKCLIFSSYHFHRSIKSNKNIRVSLDRRFFSKKMNEDLISNNINLSYDKTVHVKRLFDFIPKFSKLIDITFNKKNKKL